jgi:SPOR domain
MLLAATGPVPAAAVDVAEEILAKSIEAYQAGKLEPAIGGINAALRGRLPAVQTARAYFYRGLAYRKQGNPGRAISDFSSALEYPGLTDAERSDVAESREAAYREAGIAEGERVVVAAARETSVAPPAAPAVETAALSFQTNTVVTTASVSTPPPAAKPASSPPPPTASDWSGSTQTAVAASPPTVAPKPTVASKDLPRAAAAPWVDSKPIEVAPLPPVAPAKPASRPAPPTATATWQSVAAAPPFLAKPREAPAAKPMPPFVTQVAAITPVLPVATAAPPVVPQAAPPPVHIVVGEVSSPSEAFALSIRLISQRGAALGPRKPEIMHATMANGEILYRVRLGPYPAVSDALARCQSLRDSGYACITQ